MVQRLNRCLRIKPDVRRMFSLSAGLQGVLFIYQRKLLWLICDYKRALIHVSLLLARNIMLLLAADMIHFKPDCRYSFIYFYFHSLVSLCFSAYQLNL